MTKVIDIFVEYHQKSENVGIGETRPRLSWKIDAGEGQNWTQKAYELQITDEKHQEIHRGVVQSPQSTFVEWPSEALTSRKQVNVTVRVQGATDNEWSLWAKEITVETGLLESSDWTAKFISADRSKTMREALFRKDFEVKSQSPIAKARLYSTARGVYEVEINGNKVGNDVLSPGWTSYTHRIIQRTDKVKDQLNPGDKNTIGIRLAEGWFSGELGFSGGTTNVYGEVNMALAQLEITYEDGSVDVIVTDDSWQSTDGPIVSTGLYKGEHYDSTQEIDQWSSPATSYGGTWKKVNTHPVDVAVTPPVLPPIRCTEVLKPREIFKSDSGKTIVDFGQNFAGVVHMKKVKAEKGQKVVIYHAEVMEDGELGRRPLRAADSVDSYTFKGDANGEAWTPRFTYHGFRYIQVDNWPGTLTLDCLEGHVYNSDFSKTGWFECSNDKLNRLHENVCWSMRSNFVSVPTDCPQRDERLGWTGDIQLFAPTANYLYHCQGLLKNWLIDLADEQNDFDMPPIVCPSPLFKYDNFWSLGSHERPIAGWQDAAAIVPWHVYQQTGDLEILRAQYSSMTDWLKQLPRDEDGEFWDTNNLQLGDWLDPDAPPDNPARSKTDEFLASNAYLVHTTEIVAKIAALLGYNKDAEKYSNDVKTLRKKFEYEYLTRSGRIASQSQTAYAMAVMFRLLDGDEGSLWKEVSPAKLQTAGDVLSKIVTTDQFKIGTGFMGTPIICDALVRTGHTDLAYKMILNEENPSWLYPVSMGATTTWERWDSVLPDGKINPGEMTSFNHYAFGAVASWMHRAIGGLQSTAPGWSEVLIKPLLGGGITHASTAHDSMYGKTSSSWKIDGSQFTIDVEIPANVRATVELPDGKSHSIGSGKYSFSCSV